MKVSKNQVDQWVVEAIDMVPKTLLRKMHNLVFVVDDRPTREQVRESELRRGYALFGLYQGYEQNCKKKQRVVPDQISVFRNTLLEQYKSANKIKEQVYKTVWHEVSHHFGSSEEEALDAEKKMFREYTKQNKKRVQKREVKKETKIKRGRRGYRRKSKVTFRVKN